MPKLVVPPYTKGRIPARMGDRNACPSSWSNASLNGTLVRADEVVCYLALLLKMRRSNPAISRAPGYIMVNELIP